MVFGEPHAAPLHENRSRDVDTRLPVQALNDIKPHRAQNRSASCGDRGAQSGECRRVGYQKLIDISEYHDVIVAQERRVNIVHEEGANARVKFPAGEFRDLDPAALRAAIIGPVVDAVEILEPDLSAVMADQSGRKSASL
jgi:hypothetical protein